MLSSLALWPLEDRSYFDVIVSSTFSLLDLLKIDLHFDIFSVFLWLSVVVLRYEWVNICCFFFCVSVDQMEKVPSAVETYLALKKGDATMLKNKLFYTTKANLNPKQFVVNPVSSPL